MEIKKIRTNFLNSLKRLLMILNELEFLLQFDKNKTIDEKTFEK